MTERAVTFLGGQSGPPSLGGTFDMVAEDGTAQYRVVIPIRELAGLTSERRVAVETVTGEMR